MEAIKLWTHNVDMVTQDVLDGKEMTEDSTKYGANEFAVDFLRQNGIWEKLLVEPKQGKKNGKDWRKTAGIAILLELLHVGQIAKADKIVRDAKLMRELGFTFEEVETAKVKEKGVIHKDTIRNYYKGIPTERSLDEYYGYVNFMRGRRWIRGKEYAADGFELEVYGNTYEGTGKVYSEKEKRWKKGYKVVLLMNIEEERERIIGFAMGPINTDERKLLIRIFEDLEEKVGKVKGIIDVIVLDRGYWGIDFLEKTLAGKYGIDYVLIAKKSFSFVKEELRHWIDTGQLKFQERQLYNRTRKKWEGIEIAYAEDVYHCYQTKKKGYKGKVNVVVVKKKVNGKEKEIIYVTNKKVKKRALKIVKLYGSRWTIENQGIRDLSQRWQIRTPAGRNLKAITARICLILKLYNAMKIMEMKYGEEWQKNKEEIEAWGERSFIGGQALIIYTEEHFATFTPWEFKRLIELRTTKTTRKKERDQFIKEIEKLKEYLPRDKLEELQKKLLSE